MLALPPRTLETDVAEITAREAIIGVAVVVFRGGRAVTAKGFGTTTRGGDRKVDGDTVFGAASLTKPVFAATVLKLADAGRFDLDRPLVEYLGGAYVHRQRPWLPDGPTDTVTDPRIARITARSVISHRTGLPNIAFRRPLAFLRDPNTEWGYSGEGFLILQAAVERATGESAGALIRRLVLAPLKMSSTTFDAPPQGENVAKGYDAEGKSADAAPYGSAIGSLRTSASDYARFMLWSRRYRPFAKPLVAADPNAALDWGLGWGLARIGRDRGLFQWGWDDGFRNFALLNLRNGDGLLMLTSSDNGMELAPALVPRVFGKSLPVLKFPMLGIRDPAKG